MTQTKDSSKAILLIKRWQIQRKLNLIGTNELNLLLTLDQNETHLLSLNGQDVILEIPVEARPYRLQVREAEGLLKSGILSINPKPGEKLYLRCRYDDDLGSFFGVAILRGLIAMGFFVISAILSHHATTDTTAEIPNIPVKRTLRLERVKHEYDW